MKPSIPKGTRDFTPSEVCLRNFLKEKIKLNFELFGFIDYAEAKILKEPISGTPEKSSYIGSHGIGARLSEKSGLMLDLTIARARNEKPSQDAKRNPRVIMSLTKPF